MRKYFDWSLVLTLALLLDACGNGAENTASGSGPTASISNTISQARNNNVLGILQSALPPEALDELRSEYAAESAKATITDAQRAEFDTTMNQLTAAGAEDMLMAMIEPKLAEMSAQMPMMLGFGQMMVTQMVDENAELSDTQKQQAQDSLAAAMTALQKVDLGNTESARKAISIVCATARDLNLDSLDQLKALSFDDAMGKADVVLKGLKEVLAVYDLSLDAMLDSIQTQVVSEDGNNAKVKVSYDLFGIPLSSETEMVQVDGRWYGKDVVDAL